MWGKNQCASEIFAPQYSEEGEQKGEQRAGFVKDAVTATYFLAAVWKEEIKQKIVTYFMGASGALNWHCYFSTKAHHWVKKHSSKWHLWKSLYKLWLWSYFLKEAFLQLVILKNSLYMLFFPCPLAASFCTAALWSPFLFHIYHKGRWLAV